MASNVEVIANVSRSLLGNHSLVFGPGGSIELVRKSDYEKLEDELKSTKSNLQHEADSRVDLVVKFIKLKALMNEILDDPRLVVAMKSELIKSIQDVIK